MERDDIAAVDDIAPPKRIESAEGYLALGMHAEALAEVDAALAQQPNFEEAVSSKAHILLCAKRYREAEEWFIKLLFLRPANADGWIHLAYCRRRTRSLEAAVDALEQALRLRADHPLANYNMACYRAVQGWHGEALRFLEKAIRKDASYGRLACEEEDFKSMKRLPAFQSLVKPA